MATYAVWAMLFWSWGMTIIAFAMWRKSWAWRERYRRLSERNVQRLKQDLTVPVDEANVRQLRLKLGECEEALRTMVQVTAKEGTSNE
jgi:hypothetical protein